MNMKAKATLIIVEKPLTLVVNRNYNYTNSWTKACAILQYGHFDSKDVHKTLVASMFNPDKLISQSAAELIFKRDPELYHESGKRISSRAKRELDKLVASTSTNKSEMLIEKAFLLRQVPGFEKMSRQSIADFVKLTSKVVVSKNEILLSKEKMDDLPFYILVKGAVEVCVNNESILKIDKPSVISDVLLLDTDDVSTEVTTIQDSILYEIPQFELFDFIYDYPQFAELVIDNIDLRLKSDTPILNYNQ